MGAASERRALLLEADDSYNPFLTVNVNEYLIDEFPTLTIKQRTSVVHLCQNDEDFDYSSIHNQIDEKLYEHAETNPEVILDEVSDDSVVELDDEADENDQSVYDLMYTHLEEEWPQLTEDQMDAISKSLVEKQDELHDFLDLFIFDYANATDPSIDVSQIEDTETE
jgi:hypothetical protein